MRLQGKFLSATVPVVALALAALGLIVHAELRRDAASDLSREMRLALERAERQAALYIDVTETNVDLLAGAATIEAYFAQGEEGGRDGPLRESLIALFGKLRRTTPDYREIRLLRRDGHEELRVAEPGLVNRTTEERGTPWFDDVGLNWGASLHTAIMAHPDDGALSLLVTKPLRLAGTDASGAPTPPLLRGYLVVSAGLDVLKRQIVAQGVGPDGYLALLDADGRVLFAPEGRTASKDAPAALAALDTAASGTATDAGGEAAAGDVSVELDGRRSLVAARRLPDGLRLLAIVPESELDAAGGRLARSVAAVTGVAIVLASLLLLALLRSVILRPINDLRHRAIALGEGRPVTAPEVHRDDEIGDLADAFQEMSSRLADSMSELQESHARIERLAYRDGLTELPNRRLFAELVARALDAAAEGGSRLAVLFLDLDDFKRLNDSEGHVAGDRLLREVAVRLCRVVGAPLGEAVGTTHALANRVARVGGDEFVVLLGDVDGVGGASATAGAILAALAEPVVFDTRERTVGTSIGIAFYPDDARDADVLLASADMAMYAAKRRRKHGWCFYDASMRTEIDARLELENDLRRAVADGALRLHYQPQFHVADGTLSGVEALLRWEHPERGPIGPQLFVPVAEESGLIAPIGEWVLEEACRQWCRWQRAGLAPPRVAVNVSQRQFVLGDVATSVAAVLRRTDIDPDALELEITESCVMEGASAVIDTLEEIRAMGVHVAMDDFGTGYSSLGALTTLPIDTLKIDRCFVSGIETHSPNDKIVTAMLTLATSLGLTVVAEGVETERELDYLRRRGCDIAQGYYLGRPLSAADMTAHLREARAGVLRKAG